MRQFILCLTLLIISIYSFAQSEWVKKKVGTELSISFPQEPNTDAKPERRLTLYTFKSDESDCMFSVVVRGKAIPDFERINALPIQDKEKEINSFLDNGIVQFIQNSKIISPSSSIRVGKFIGKQITYSQFNDATGKWFTQYTKFVFAGNNLYIIQCSIYKESSCLNDKNKFLNSIITN
jgi:hypothetical protein